MKNLILFLALFMSLSAFSQQTIMNGNISSDVANDVTVTNKLTIGDSLNSPRIATDIIYKRSARILDFFGTDNLFFGINAGNNTLSGTLNFYFGNQSGKSTTSGSNNIYFGYQSGFSSTTANNNLGIGNYSLYSTSNNGNFNLAIGYGACYTNTTSDSNVVIGYYAGRYTAGNSNTLLGTRAGYGVTGNVYSHNTAIGYQSQYSITTGSYNTSLGYMSGYSNASGSNNVFIGYKAGYSETGSNKLYIDNSATATPLIHGDFSTNLITINGNETITGDINYLPPHGNYYFENQTLTISIATSEVYVDLTNGTRTLFTTDETTNITFAGDSATILSGYNGDYEAYWGVTFEGSNDKDYRIVMVKNHVTKVYPVRSQAGKGAGRAMNLEGFTYLKSLVAGDDIKLRITSEDASDPVLISGYFYLRKAH